VVEELRLDGLDPASIGDRQPLIGGELGLDSVDALELVVALEREFGIAMASEQVGGGALASVAALADWLQGELERARAAAG